MRHARVAVLVNDFHAFYNSRCFVARKLIRIHVSPQTVHVRKGEEGSRKLRKKETRLLDSCVHKVLSVRANNLIGSEAVIFVNKGNIFRVLNEFCAKP
jgi:hypothetical protein